MTTLHSRSRGWELLQSALQDPDVDDVLIVRGCELWTASFGRLESHGNLSAIDVERFLEESLASTGRRLDRVSPIVNTRLANGARLCAITRPVATDGFEVAIRRHRQHEIPLTDFGESSTCDLVRSLVAHRANLIICGATGSGKTTLLATLVRQSIIDGDRVIAIEDTNELECVVSSETDAGHLVLLQARPATVDSPYEVTLHDLLVTSLRLRPDRIVVGEIRGAEVTSLIHAMNTGHNGSMATCHANSPEDALRRITQLAVQFSPNWPQHNVVEQLERSVDAVVFMRQRADGQRIITDIVEPSEGTHRQLVKDGFVVAAPTRSHHRKGNDEAHPC